MPALHELTVADVNEVIHRVNKAQQDIASLPRKPEPVTGGLPSHFGDGWLERVGREHKAYQPVRKAINQLPMQARRELIALMLIGRGDGVGGVSIFPHLVKRADAEHAASYLDGKGALLAKYLRDGLDKMGLARRRRG